MITLLGPTIGSMASGKSTSESFWARPVYFAIIAGYGWPSPYLTPFGKAKQPILQNRGCLAKMVRKDFFFKIYTIYPIFFNNKDAHNN